MIVTGAFFADAVRSADGKLFVLGGVWDSYTTSNIGTGAADTLELVILVQAGADDPSREVDLTVEVFAPDGDQIVTGGHTYSMRGDAENGFVILSATCAFQKEGRHNFVVSARGSDHSTALALDVRAPQRS